MKFVFDASSLIILHQTAQFQLISKILVQMNSCMVLLKSIEDEIMSVPTDAMIEYLNPERVNFTPSSEFIPQLGLGERSVIEYVLTKENPSRYICVLDDLKARKKAKYLKIQFVGLLGLTGRGYELCTIKTKRNLQMIWGNWSILDFRIPKSKNLEIFLKSLKKI